MLFTSAGRWINNRICCWHPSSVFTHTIRWVRNSDIDALCPLQKKKKVDKVKGLIGLIYKMKDKTTRFDNSAVWI